MNLAIAYRMNVIGGTLSDEPTTDDIRYLEEARGVGQIEALGKVFNKGVHFVICWAARQIH